MFLYAWKYIPKQLLRLFPQESRNVESYSRSSVAWTLSILLKGLKVATYVHEEVHITQYIIVLYFLDLEVTFEVKMKGKKIDFDFSYFMS